MLASVFYVHKNYLASLSVINYALSKCTHDKVYPWQFGLNQSQEFVLNLMKHEKLSTITKTMTIKFLRFYKRTSIFPQELKLNNYENVCNFHPLAFAHFLSFLCYYHLHEMTACNQSSIQLHQTILMHLSNSKLNPYDVFLSLICLGKVFQMMGKKSLARQCFLEIALKADKCNVSSAARRLSELT